MLEKNSLLEDLVKTFVKDTFLLQLFMETNNIFTNLSRSDIINQNLFIARRLPRRYKYSWRGKAFLRNCWDWTPITKRMEKSWREKVQKNARKKVIAKYYRWVGKFLYVQV